MTTITDKYAGAHSSCHPVAVAAYERAVLEFAAQRPCMSSLDAALQIEPQMPAALAFKGLAGVLTGRSGGVFAARAACSAVGAALASADGGTANERALAKALQAGAAGRLKRAAFHLEQHLECHPQDLLALKLAHALRFMTGQPDEMLRTSTAVLPSWSDTTPGYGFFLGCRAFALEETGDFTSAEETGLMAITHQPDDMWGLHAVAHVMEMTGRTREGRALLGGAQTRWTGCGVFGQHLVWHLALFHLAEGDRDGALALFDAQIRLVGDGDFRDVANAVSLLWRLEQEGVEVGARWEIAHEIARQRRLDTTYAFASLHYLMALLGAGDMTAAQECVEAMRRNARGNASDQSVVLARVGVPLADLLLSIARHKPSRQRLEQLACDLPMLGGSRAQQDVFLRSLMVMAAQSNNGLALSSLSAMRSSNRVVDRFQASLASRAIGGRHVAIVPAHQHIREAS